MHPLQLPSARSGPNRNRLQTVALALAGLLLAATPGLAVDGVREINQAAALAGSVTPGDGAGFPVTLSEPGSYRLTGPLVVPDGTVTAILVAAGDVALDLNGFEIRCVAPCLGNTGRGIDTAFAIENLRTTVRNGTITGMGGDGMTLLGVGTVEDMILTNNGGYGLLSGDQMQVRRCIARENGNDGLRVSASSVVEGNTTTANGGAGIFAEFGSVVSHNASNDNTGVGIYCRSDCNVFENSVLRNGVGIDAIGLVRANTVTMNTGFGLSTDGTTGYGSNVFRQNNTPAGAQVSGGIEIAPNICGISLSCP